MPIFEFDTELILAGIRIDAENEVEARSKVGDALDSWVEDCIPLDPDSVEVVWIIGKEVD